MSRLVCTMPVRNEDWILGLSLRAVLLWCDAVVILDHASEDDSRAIMEEVAVENPGRVLILDEADPQWNEMAHRQRLLEAARSEKATHIVMVDADEVLTGNLLPVIRNKVIATPPGATMQLPWQCLRGGIDQYHADGTWGTADVSMAFKDEPRCYWKARNGYDFHHRHPMGRPNLPWRPALRSDGGLMHLQFVDDRRLRAKQALYKMLEVTRWPGREPVPVVNRMYNVAVYGSEYQALAGHGRMNWAPAEWWEVYKSLMQHLKLGAEPWQERECRKLWEQYSGEVFRGLDLFGVIR